MLTQKFFLIAQSGAEAVLWLLLLSILSIAMILERLLTLKKIKNQSEKFQTRIRETLQSNNLEELEELSKDRDSLEGRALSYGLRHLNASGSKGLEEIFNSFVLIEKPKLEKFLTFLATLGANGPFIGLLGTVFGIMKAFNDLGQKSEASMSGTAATAVMTGIAEALVATAVGLLVAIPAVVAYNYFQKQVKGILQSIESAREVCVAYAKQKGK